MSRLDILGVTEAAELLGISVVTFKNWQRAKTAPLPEPDAVLRCGPIWRRSTIERYMRGNEKVALATRLGAPA